MGLTKRELVEYVRIAEYNQEVAEETLNQQAENVKDWIPVVRCKDCKYSEWDCDCSLYLCRHHGCDWNNGEHFCSYGERGEKG